MSITQSAPGWESLPAWRNRPADQRFFCLDSLHTVCRDKAEASVSQTFNATEVIAVNHEDRDIRIETPKFTGRVNDWSFSQLAGLASVPGEYLKRICPELAVINLNYGLQYLRHVDNSLFYWWPNGQPETPELRAVTGTGYGRYHDFRCVEDVQEITNGEWTVPWDLTERPAATTLYTSDRDVWMFLVDQKHEIKVPGQEKPAYRGFLVRNSEVGAGSWSLQSFLYNTVCDNRMVLGMTEIGSIKIRHSSSAPDRIRWEGKAMLRDFANASPAQIETRLKRAQEIRINRDENPNEWIRKQGFTKAMSDRIFKRALDEQGKCETAWDAIQGLTAMARDVPNTDHRVRIETDAGLLFDRISKN